jgi:hypothetical protein
MFLPFNKMTNDLNINFTILKKLKKNFFSFQEETEEPERESSENETDKEGKGSSGD